MVDFDICKGNPGAITFVMGAYADDMFRAEMCFQKMQNNNITGAKLYMLWNDCCGRNTKMALDVMDKISIEEIERHINYTGGRGIPFMEHELPANN